MAEILLLAFDCFNTTHPERDATMTYKLGHVIAIMPDGHEWGSQECLPKFYIIKIPGVSVDDLQDYIASKIDWLAEKGPKRIGIRKWKLNLTKVPAGQRSVLQTLGVVTVANKAVFEAFLDQV